MHSGNKSQFNKKITSNNTHYVNVELFLSSAKVHVGMFSIYKNPLCKVNTDAKLNESIPWKYTHLLSNLQLYLYHSVDSPHLQNTFEPPWRRELKGYGFWLISLTGNLCFVSVQMFWNGREGQAFQIFFFCVCYYLILA